MDTPDPSVLTATTDFFTCYSPLSVATGSTIAPLTYLLLTNLQSGPTQPRPQPQLLSFVWSTNANNWSSDSPPVTNLPRRHDKLSPKYGSFAWALPGLINSMCSRNSPLDFLPYPIITLSNLLISKSRLGSGNKQRNDPRYGRRHHSVGSIWWTSVLCGHWPWITLDQIR